MSLKRNIAANYISQVYVLVISILMLPKLIELMGPEAYGLVGFFAMLQSWLMLLDLGMTPTMSREISRYRGGAISGNEIRQVFNTLIKLFIAMAVVCAVVIGFSSGLIANRWLNSETLPFNDLYSSVTLMGVIVASRWISSFLRSAVIGFEKMVWLSSYNAVFATLRFVVIVPVLIYFGATPVVYFLFQLVVAVFELAAVALYARKLLPHYNPHDKAEKRSLRTVVQFSLTIAFTSAVWVLVTQTDKLLLSKLMSLSEFGYYTLAVQLAGGITLISGPLSSAIIPRMAKLEAEGNQEALIKLYRESTQWIVLVTGTVSLMLIFFAKDVLLMWTDNIELTTKVSPYLILYAIGNFILSVAAFPYYLQYAKGNLKFHLYGNIAFVTLLIPSLIFVVSRYGGIGAGFVWIGVNLIYFLAWIPFIHHYFSKGLNTKWYIHDIGKTLIVGFVLAFIFSYAGPHVSGRVNLFVYLALVSVCVGLANLLAAKDLRTHLFQLLNRFKK